MKERTERFIQRAASIAIVVMTLITGATLVGRWLPSTGSADGYHPGYKTGEAFDIGRDVIGEGQVFVVLARSTCPHCQVERDRIREILPMVRANNTRVVFLAVNGKVPKEVLFAKEMGFSEDEVVMDPSLASKHIRSVPTVVVVSEAGKILYAHEGEGADPKTIQEVL